MSPDPQTMDNLLLELFAKDPTREFTIRDLYESLHRPLNDRATRSSLWRLLNSAFLEMTPTQTFRFRQPENHKVSKHDNQVP